MIRVWAECDGCGKKFPKETIGTGGVLSLTNAIIAAGWHVRQFSHRSSLHACSDECKAKVAEVTDKPTVTGWSGSRL